MPSSAACNKQLKIVLALFLFIYFFSLFRPFFFWQLILFHSAFFFILLTPTRRRRQKKVDKSTCFVVSYFLCACTFYCYRIHRKFVKMENKFFKTKMQKKNRHDRLWCEIIKNKLRKSIKIDLEVRNEVFYFKLLLID